MRTRSLLAAAVVLAGAGCGASSDTGAGAVAGPAPTATTASEASADSPLPRVDVVDVASGETVDLAAFLPADKPMLLWFWAPH